MAAFVVAFGWTPKDYYETTLSERNAIVRAMNKRNS